MEGLHAWAARREEDGGDERDQRVQFKLETASRLSEVTCRLLCQVS